LRSNVDPEAVQRKREAQIKEFEGEIKRAEGKLANKGFVDKAPDAVVQAERDKLDRFRKDLDELAQ
jgi:valyl-tRNA synthetase